MCLFVTIGKPDFISPSQNRTLNSDNHSLKYGSQFGVAYPSGEHLKCLAGSGDIFSCHN